MSENKTSKSNLIEQPHFSSLLLDTIDSLVAVLDREGRILTFNKACEKTTGYTFKEVKGHVFFTYHTFIDKGKTEEGMKRVKKLFKEGRSQ